MTKKLVQRRSRKSEEAKEKFKVEEIDLKVLESLLGNYK